MLEYLILLEERDMILDYIFVEHAIVVDHTRYRY
jgi:hypothetical protein